MVAAFTLASPVMLHGTTGVTLIILLHWLTQPLSQVAFSVRSCGPGAVAVTFTEEPVFDPTIWSPAEAVQKYVLILAGAV